VYCTICAYINGNSHNIFRDTERNAAFTNKSANTRIALSIKMFGNCNGIF
jgi:hypothetical protein